MREKGETLIGLERDKMDFESGSENGEENNGNRRDFNGKFNKDLNNR